MVIEAFSDGMGDQVRQCASGLEGCYHISHIVCGGWFVYVWNEWTMQQEEWDLSRNRTGVYSDTYPRARDHMTMYPSIHEIRNSFAFDIVDEIVGHEHSLQYLILICLFSDLIAD